MYVVEAMWQSPIHLSMGVIEARANLRIKGNACVWKEAKTGESLDHV